MGTSHHSRRRVWSAACLLTCAILLDVIHEISADPRSARQSLELRKSRVSRRYQVVGPNETIVGVKLPAPWDSRVPGPLDPDFAAAQEAAWGVMETAISTYVSNSRVKGAIAPNSIESFASVPNVFRLYGFNPASLASLRLRPGILFASNDPGVVNVQAPALSKGDLIHPAQIGLENPGDVPYTDVDGQRYVSRKDVDIDVFGAWNHTVGNSDVVVAIIDDGFDLTKPELAATIYTNTKETPCNGLDDDRNGFIDDYQGYNADLKNGCAAPPSRSGQGRVAHGTSMALALASSPRTATGTISGVAPGIRFLPIAAGQTLYRGLDNAYAYVLAMKRAGVPIRVLNVSLGSVEPLPWACSPITKKGDSYTLLGELITSGITIVAAAGNEGMNIDSTFVCPSSLAKTFETIITVASVDLSGRAPFFSNFGTKAATISAPGTAIYTGYGYQTGTSVATALVSGAVALMYSSNPALTPEEVKRTLIETAKMTDLNLPTQSKGLLSAGNAVQAVARKTSPAIRKPPL